MDQICTASEYACKMPETKCGFAKGDQFYLKDLLYSLMLESHNDSAVVIAETLGGSVENFSKMMNDKAKELGCENSHFVTPNGLDGSDAGGDHGSTAYDLAKIMSYCIKNDTFLEITQAKNHTFTDLKKEHTYQLSNKNSFLSMQKGAVSGKTGYTAKAGYCYVCAYKDNGRVYALALLACGWPNHKSYKWSDSKKLIAYGNENYKEQVIDRKENIPGIRITGGVKKESGNYEFPGTVSLKEEEKEISCLVSDSDQISITYECPDILKAPLKKGQEAGTAKYFINDTYIGSKKLFVNEDVTAFDLGWCLKQFLQEFLQKASI